VDQTKLSILEISSRHSVIVNLTTKCLKISAVLETPDLLLSSWFSGTPVMRTQKGNKKQFELAGVQVIGQVNIQVSISVVNS